MNVDELVFIARTMGKTTGELHDAALEMTTAYYASILNAEAQALMTEAGIKKIEKQADIQAFLKSAKKYYLTQAETMWEIASSQNMHLEFFEKINAKEHLAQDEDQV